MPAEWEPHEGTWLTWPRPDGISFPGRFEVVPERLTAFVLEIVRSERVFINVWDEATGARLREDLVAAGVPDGRLEVHPFPSYEPWCRDHGPIFVVRERDGVRERAVVDWGYNAWGGKYPPYDLDNEVPRRVADLRGLPRFEGGMILEGGSIEVDGRGTLLTTEACLLNPNRNPGLDRQAIEARLRRFLGVRRVLWLGDGIVGDDTDGHIDDLTRFVDAETLVTVVEEDPADANFGVLRDNLARLRAFRTADGAPYRIVTLPMPRPVVWDGQRLPASYANFYVTNGSVVVPAFGQESDEEARRILEGCFPGRRVVSLNSLELIWGLGSFHCLSQQEAGADLGGV